MVTTVDAFHSQYLVRAMERGIDVMTEKPMVIDEAQCRAVLDAEKQTGRKIVVTHNYRYAPKHQKIKELLMARRDRQDHVGRFHLVPRHHARRRLFPALAPPAREERLALGAQGVAPLRSRSTGGSTPSRCRCRRSAAWRTTARAARSATRTAGPARTRASVRTTGTSTRARTSSRSTTTASRPTAISATAASSRKTSTSSTR